MKIGFVGLGKLGLPCALAIESKGHEVCGWDSNEEVQRAIKGRTIRYDEAGAQELLSESKISVVPVEVMVRTCDIIFIAVQTPSEEWCDGTHLMTGRELDDWGCDFDYGPLTEALCEVSNEARDQDVKESVTVCVVSTVVPGTMEKIHRKLNLQNSKLKVFYNPFFIAMGTCIHDFLHPEMVIIGSGFREQAEITKGYETVRDFYCDMLPNVPVPLLTIPEAELTKMSYNTFIGLKICFGNQLMEIAHNMRGINCDRVVDALSLATDRLISPKYLRGGMGDGGGCHPRDAHAMAWLSQKTTDTDIFERMIRWRELQSDFIAGLVLREVRTIFPRRPVVLCGIAYKPNSTLEIGSPALLLDKQLEHYGLDVVMHNDPCIDGSEDGTWFESYGPAVCVITTKHDLWPETKFVPGSTIIDPHRYMPDIPGCKVIRVGSGELR